MILRISIGVPENVFEAILGIMDQLTFLFPITRYTYSILVQLRNELTIFLIILNRTLYKISKTLIFFPKEKMTLNLSNQPKSILAVIKFISESKLKSKLTVYLNLYLIKAASQTLAQFYIQQELV